MQVPSAMKLKHSISSHVYSSERHTTSYIACGNPSGPLVIFCHGWPELGYSWRHQLPVLAGLGFYAVAPDLRGYGNSTNYKRYEDYRLEDSMHDVLDLMEGGLGRKSAIFVGHDYGAPVVWQIAGCYPEKVVAAAGICVPYFPMGFGLTQLISKVDRELYPESEYPMGQWDYQLYYLNQFAQAQKELDDDVTFAVRCLFRAGNPADQNTRSRTAEISKRGGWFVDLKDYGDIPRDETVISEEDEQAYVESLKKNSFFGPGACYMNHERNVQYYLENRKNEGRLKMPVLFIHALYGNVCETVGNPRMMEEMRGSCDNLSEATVKTGHWMAQEKPEDLNSVLVKWLATKVPDAWPVDA